MTLHCEIEAPRDEVLARTVAVTLRTVCNLRGDVVFEAPGALANDGKVIDDRRKYD